MADSAGFSRTTELNQEDPAGREQEEKKYLNLTHLPPSDPNWKLEGMGADEGRSGETNGEYQIQYHTNKHERRIKCTVHNQNNLANTLFKNIQEKKKCFMIYVICPL